jgi:hypothetical protein
LHLPDRYTALFSVYMGALLKSTQNLHKINTKKL